MRVDEFHAARPQTDADGNVEGYVIWVSEHKTDEKYMGTVYVTPAMYEYLNTYLIQRARVLARHSEASQYIFLSRQKGHSLWESVRRHLQAP